VHVRAFPPAFLKEPVSGGVFDNVESYQVRLQGFAFTEGFATSTVDGTCDDASDDVKSWPKMAPTMKAFEAEKAPKQGTGQGRAGPEAEAEEIKK
jgi:hypothetical protein